MIMPTSPVLLISSPHPPDMKAAGNFNKGNILLYLGGSYLCVQFTES